MGLTAQLMAMIAMAIATIAILTVGTLAAADLLPTPPPLRENRSAAARDARRAEAEHVPSQAEPTTADQDKGDLVDAFAPLGSSLYAGVCLNAPGGAAEDRDRPLHPTA